MCLATAPIRVVRFIDLRCHLSNPQHSTELATGIQLKRQSLIWELTIGFVVWAQLVAKTAAQTFIKGAEQMLGVLVAQHIQHKGGKAVDSMGRMSRVEGLPILRQSEIAAENID